MSRHKYKVTRIPHSFNENIKVGGYMYCQNCGLVALKNQATRKAISKPCEVKEDV